MSQDKYTRPDGSTQLSTAYKANIDNGFETFESGVGTNFQAHEQTSPDMTVKIEAGVIYDHSNSTRTEYSAASTSTITAPSTQSRIDLISIHQGTGALTVTTGTESSTPSAPSLPSSNFPIAEISLATTTTQITNSLISDVRVPFTIGGGSSGLSELSDDSTPQLGGNLDLQGYDIIDTNGNEILEFTAAASAVNHLKSFNAATGVGPKLQAVGDDSNIDLYLKGKGLGAVALGNAELKFPNTDGSAGDIITTDGSGNLSLSPGGGAEVLLATDSAASSASITLTGTLSGYKAIRVVGRGIKLSTDTNVELTVTVSSVEQTGASDYGYHCGIISSSLQSDDAADHVRLNATTCGGGSNEFVSFDMVIDNPTSASHHKMMKGQIAYKDTGGSLERPCMCNGVYQSASLINGVVIRPASGNMTLGEFELYGIK